MSNIVQVRKKFIRVGAKLVTHRGSITYTNPYTIISSSGDVIGYNDWQEVLDWLDKEELRVGYVPEHRKAIIIDAQDAQTEASISFTIDLRRATADFLTFELTLKLKGSN